GVLHVVQLLRAALPALAADPSPPPGDARPAASGSGVHREHGARRVAHDLLGDAPDQEMGEPGAAPGSHDDTGRAPGCVDDAPGRVADHDARFHPASPTERAPDELFELLPRLDDEIVTATRRV